jgi:hypothetical protein
LLPLILAILFLYLIIIPTEAVVTKALLSVSTLSAVLRAALLAVVEFLHVHTADLAEWHMRSHLEPEVRKL